jgi:hypothetical protein
MVKGQENKVGQIPHTGVHALKLGHLQWSDRPFEVDRQSRQICNNSIFSSIIDILLALITMKS